MPPFELSDADRAGMTPDEIESLTGSNVDDLLKAHGGSEPAAAAADTGDDDAGDKPAAEAKPAAAAAAAADADDLPGADDLAELLEDEQPAAATKAPAPFKIEGPADYKAERQALRDQKAAIETKWGDGDLSDTERAAALVDIDDKIDDLLIAHTRAETLRTANQQAAEQAAEQGMNDAVLSVLNSAKTAGTIDYSADTKAAKQFDTFLTMLQADPDNAALTPAALTVQAHKSVLALRGIADKAPTTTTAPTAAPAAAPAPPARRDVPTATLAGLPNAAPTGMEDEALMKFATLEGEDAEDYLASLPQREQDRILRASDATAMKHTGDSRSLRQRARA